MEETRSSGCRPQNKKITDNARGLSPTRSENTQGWKEMPFYGQIARQSEDQRSDETWTWLKEGKLKRETESLIIAAQDQAIRTNYVKTTIDKSQEDLKSRMCKQNNETISHIVSGCPKLVQKEYKKRYDNVARAAGTDPAEVKWVNFHPPPPTLF